MACFNQCESGLLVDAHSKKSAAYFEQLEESITVRIGYDLFTEVQVLLTTGQPPVHAMIPALEVHIAILRDLIITSGVDLMEIPPVPEKYNFIACLTHDVDHPSIRKHFFDHTMLGFLYRALVTSLGRLVRGQASLKEVAINWAAASKLPLVYLGFAKDFWLDFVRYPQIEGEAKSSFFVIPFPGSAGQIGIAKAPSKRAARYGAADIEQQLRALQKASCEIGLHGIDAWHDSAKGYAELEEIRKFVIGRDIGVRMHWLYFDADSPAILEEAGANYDSTVGFNDAVGYRAGTTQVYKPLSTKKLLELPLHVMDTALFYPTRMSLTQEEAFARVQTIIKNAAYYGGVVTVNWHDRSISPDRCWDQFYVDVIDNLRECGAWFATASETVAWFRQRRGCRFDRSGKLVSENDSVESEKSIKIPALQVRTKGGIQSRIAENVPIGEPRLTKP
jgi:peptidoglycan/xylan/chitin deacetylase (PgdA/CDA1 family)